MTISKQTHVPGDNAIMEWLNSSPFASHAPTNAQPAFSKQRDVGCDPYLWLGRMKVPLASPGGGASVEAAPLQLLVAADLFAEFLTESIKEFLLVHPFQTNPCF